jgi:hypothetical protein
MSSTTNTTANRAITKAITAWTIDSVFIAALTCRELELNEDCSSENAPLPAWASNSTVTAARLNLIGPMFGR